MPCGSQVIATEPLSAEQAASLLPQDYCVEDCNYLLDYFRLSADKRLIYGGGVVYGARDPANIEAIIRPKMLKTFPQLQNVKIDYAWTGNFLLTLSRQPLDVVVTLRAVGKAVQWFDPRGPLSLDELTEQALRLFLGDR